MSRLALAPTLVGKLFGRLYALGVVRGKWGPACLVSCTCGKGKIIYPTQLLSGKARSCGCLRNELSGARTRTHGLSNTSEHRIWKGIIKRCYNQNAPHFERYGGRGIAVCAEWRHDFKAFLGYVGPRPTPKHSIDRYPNPDGNYEPGNVRWAVQCEQVRNSTRTKFLEVNGERLCLSDWGKRLGLAPDSITRRIKAGWPIDQALTTPPRSVPCA